MRRGPAGLALTGPGGYHEDLDSAMTQLDWGATLASQPARTEEEQR